LQIVGETLCEQIDLRSGAKVLDVAAGNGNATLAAARRWCDVTSTDYVPSLLESGRKRAQAEGHEDRDHRGETDKLPASALLQAVGTAAFTCCQQSGGNRRHDGNRGRGAR
jgi:tRNA/tmRNA/rRNA uracil-C5-methylase (TrmA/RlmC/RlmD family)